jgi:hypothetical protein
VTLLTRTRAEYRVIRLRDPGFVLIESPPDPVRGLEFWRKGEPESPDPAHWVIETFGPGITVLDVAGDITSHYLRLYDGWTRQVYRRFTRSLNSAQVATLHAQYDYAVANYDETRPYPVWLNIAGLPAYFRAYPFHQGWPQTAYTKGQRQLLSAMVTYLRTGRH